MRSKGYVDEDDLPAVGQGRRQFRLSLSLQEENSFECLSNVNNLK